MDKPSLNKRQFERLFASLYDFGQANFCARYLLTKGWHRKWERQGTIYAQQTAFVTNLVVAYARPFVKSQGWPTFPEKLTNFDAKQSDLHKRLLQMRHQIIAHSDSKNFSFEPVKFDNIITTTECVPSYVLSSDDTALVIRMTDDLIITTNKKLDGMHRELTKDTYGDA